MEHEPHPAPHLAAILWLAGRIGQPVTVEITIDGGDYGTAIVACAGKLEH